MRTKANSRKKNKVCECRIIDGWLKKLGRPEYRDPKDPSSAGWLLFEGTKRDCENWILDGLRSTEGAERDHYVDLLIQLEDGLKELDYRRV